MSGDHNANQKAKSFYDIWKTPQKSFFEAYEELLPGLAGTAGMTISKNIHSQTRFHGSLENLEAFAFIVGEDRLDHCLNVLRQAGYDEAADFLQGVG
jgi:hypothetical protein